MRRAVKCRCTDKNCTRWYVDPEASQEDIGEFTEEQARQVGRLLDKIDHESGYQLDNTEDILRRLEIEENILGLQYKYGGTYIPPNYIVPVRSDLLSAAYIEIKSLRKQLREKETQP